MTNGNEEDSSNIGFDPMARIHAPQVKPTL